VARSKTPVAEPEQMTVRFPREMLALLKEQAAINDRSLNAEIVHRCRFGLKSLRLAQSAEAGHTLR
jgi:hypothetical protein